MKGAQVGVLLIAWLVFAGCSSQKTAPPVTQLSTVQKGESRMLNLSSAAFEANMAIPAKYSCKGDDVSPPLAWKNAPTETRSFALIFDDPDAPAGTWVHLVVFNIPAEMDTFPEDISLPPDISVGKNSWGNTRYGGPCPPSGIHRYFFKLYALDTDLSLKDGASKTDLLAAMEHHILAQAELMGTFSK